jgi:hypothetical protein
MLELEGNRHASAWAADRKRIEALEKENLGLLDAAVKAAERGEEEKP